MRLRDHLEQLASSNDVDDKPALVVQGGGLRGVYSIAALAALEELGLRDAFSFVIGSSAGACNGAYFLSRQAREGIRIYVDDLSGPEFVSLRRPWKIVDIDFLIDVALKQRHPFNVQELRAAPAPLYTVLTDADSGAEVIVSSKDPSYDPYEVIRATAALPGLYNRKIMLGDKRYIDGGVANQIPLAEAFSRGAQEALVILTRGRGYRRNGHGVMFRAFSRLMARGQSSAVKRRLGAADPEFNEVAALLEDERSGSHRRTWSVWPSDLGQLVGRTTSDRVRLLECADMARRDMMALLHEKYSPNRTTPSDSAP